MRRDVAGGAAGRREGEGGTDLTESFHLSIRIYALAKELKLENKKLVDICNQIGITGKGSALASLTDEEVAAIKAHLDKGKAGRGGAAAPSRGAAPVRREDYVAPSGAAPVRKVPALEKKPSTIVSRRASPAPVETPVEELAEPPAPIEPVETPTAVEVPPAYEPAPAEPVAPEMEEAPPSAVPEIVAAPPEEEAPPVAEPTVVAEAPPVVEQAPEIEPPAEPVVEIPPEAPPASEPPQRFVPVTSSPVRVLPTRTPAKKPGSKPAKPAQRSGPAIRVAPVPQSSQPVVAKTNEPAPQKPEIRLAPEVIRASKLGLKPLSEHLKKQEEKRKAGQTGTKKPGAKDRIPEVTLPPADAGRLRDKDRRRGKTDGAAAEEEKPVTLGGREQRQLKRKRNAAARTSDDDDRPVLKTSLRRQRRGSTVVSTAAPRKSHVVIELPCTVRSFSEAVGVPAAQVMGKLMELGAPAIITAAIQPDMAEMLAESLGVEVDFRQPVTLEEKLLQSAEQPDEPESLQARPPVVTFLGHVDHGKTSLLDRILGLDVAAHEKGGITQHIRAYQIEKDGRPISFVDTPGHEAFTAMRARGAMVTDIAVLVVAADDGVMPQTEEAISHAKAAGVPIIVALNKIDLPGVNIDRIFQQLATAGLLPSEWGGDVEVVRTSAITGQGMDELLETVLTVAELHEYKANPERAAVGVCLEAEVQQGRGVVAKVIVQKGTLHVGDIVVCGPAHGRIKAMYDTLNAYKKLKEAGPATPVNLTGLDVAPGAGDRFYAVDDIALARQVAADKAQVEHRKELAGVQKHVTLEDLFQRITEQEEVQNLNIILRADVRGSVEAILKELGKLQHPEVQIKVLQASVGGVTEADVHLADASDAVIIGFNVVPDEKARVLADQLGVQIRRYDIIYQVSEDLRKALEGMLRPEKRETDLGRALVKRVFHISRVGAVAGCQVLAGTVQRDARVRLIRESRVIGEYGLDSLKREKDDAREVRQGFECGIKLAGFDDLKEGDILEVYRIEEIRRTL